MTFLRADAKDCHWLCHLLFSSAMRSTCLNSGIFFRLFSQIKRAGSGTAVSTECEELGD